jgi:N-acetylneuraminate synthase
MIMNLKEYIDHHSIYDQKTGDPVIIAEAGVNHEGSMSIAKRMIEEASEGGAHAIKFQTYKAEKLASKDSPFYWDIQKEPTRSQYELFKKYDKFWKKEYEALKMHCDKMGIEFLSTPFDSESAEFLNDLMNVYKISSSDLNNTPFIQQILSFRKPILLSTGASYLWEIQRTVQMIEEAGINYCLMHCILNYPTETANANLNMINTLKSSFPNAVIGYSDHTLPEHVNVITSAYILGARIIEKHFTHDKTLPGNDHYHAMDKEDLKVIISQLEHTKNILGSGIRVPLPSEELSRKNARRSLVAARNIKKDQVITEEDITWKRPAFGIPPDQFNLILGKKARIDITEDTLFQWNMIS